VPSSRQAFTGSTLISMQVTAATTRFVFRKPNGPAVAEIRGFDGADLVARYRSDI
jgi:hypothetical protein